MTSRPDEQLAADLASLRIDRSGARTPNPILRGLAALAVVGAVAWGAARVGKPLLEARVFKTEVAVTEIASISPAQAQVELTATGYAIPQRTARVAAKVVGRIAKTELAEGASVRAGDTLFELDATDLDASLAAARAKVVAASARVGTIQAQRAEIAAELERQRKLADDGAAPRAPADDLARKLASIDAQIRATEAEVAAANADVTALATGRGNLAIASPIDGVVLSKPAGVGDVTTPGVPLVELADFGSILIEADVPEARLGPIQPGAPCEVVLDALPNDRLVGSVVELAPRLNRAKATGTVKVRVENAPALLRPEMSARVSFLQKPLDEAARTAPPKIVVPAAALVDRAGGKAVWVVEGGKLRLETVVVGEAFGTGFVLEKGPPPGTRLVKNPSPELRDGSTVEEKSS